MTMSNDCSDVQAVVAAGEALAPAQAAHLEGCAACQEVARAGRRLGEALAARRGGAATAAADAALVARVTAGAARRLRRRGQVALASAGLVAVAGAVVVWVSLRGAPVATRGGEIDAVRGTGPVQPAPVAPAPAPEPVAEPERAPDAEIALSALDDALAQGARWAWVTEPLADVDALAPGAKPVAFPRRTR
jgi:hypothetical protein